MKVQLEHPADEIKRLQRCINDLVSLLALPAMWSGSKSCDIVPTLLDSLLRMLDLDFLYVNLTNLVDTTPSETIRVAQSQEQMFQPQELCTFLNRWLGDDPQKRYLQERSHIGDEEVSLVSWPLGVQREIGVIVAGSRRADFPRDTEALLLSIAANQALTGLQQARLLSEQKRVADELDQSVAQRTAQLAAANEVLRMEVAERRRAEEALRASEINFRVIVNSIPGLVCTMSPAGEVITLNKQLLEYFGKAPEELKSWKMTDAVHPDDLPRVVTAFDFSIRTGTPYEVEHRCRRADGVYRWFQVRALPVQEKDCQNAGWYVLLTDIEDRKRAEEELHRSEAFLAEAQRLSLTGSFSWHIDTDEITFSEQLYRTFELDPDAPVTLKQIGSRVHPEDISLLSEKMDLARSNIADHDYGIRLQMPDGRVKYLRTKSYGIRHKDGRLEHVGAIQDVTEHRLAEEALSKLRSELTHMARVTSLGALTASIAHEVNQPLSGIVTNASTCLRLLTLDPTNVDGARETARRTIRDGNRASDVITRLRALFTGKELTKESMDLNEATREVIALSMNELHRHRVMLRPELADDLPLVTANRVQLQQVILNLLRNAADAMVGVDDRPRQLFIRTERDEGDRVRLTVQDVGVGLEPHVVDKLFQAFFTTKSSGMGIGLSVSRSIIEKHGGRLWGEPNDGPGATFAFSIPRVPVRTTDAARVMGTS